MSKFKQIMAAIAMALCLVVTTPAPVQANEYGTETGDDVSIIVDLLVLRPAGLVAMAGGTVFFVASLPFSLPTLSVGKTWRALVVTPTKYTFVRKMGEEY